MIGYELFVASKPGETWMVTQACKEHRNPDMAFRPFTRMEGDDPCKNGCRYERVLKTVEMPAQTFQVDPPKCDLCATGAELPKSLGLHAKCHLTAPLAVRFEGDVLILSCYVPECSREVGRFKVVRSP